MDDCIEVGQSLQDGSFDRKLLHILFFSFDIEYTVKFEFLIYKNWTSRLDFCLRPHAPPHLHTDEAILLST